MVGGASTTEILVANTYNLLRYRAYSLRDENDIIVGGAQAKTKFPAIMVILIDIYYDNIFYGRSVRCCRVSAQSL